MVCSDYLVAVVCGKINENTRKVFCKKSKAQYCDGTDDDPNPDSDKIFFREVELGTDIEDAYFLKIIDGGE